MRLGETGDVRVECQRMKTTLLMSLSLPPRPAEPTARGPASQGPAERATRWFRLRGMGRGGLFRSPAATGPACRVVLGGVVCEVPYK